MKAEWTNKDSLSIESTGQKAILVIDMPIDCAECQFCGWGGRNLEKYVCSLTKEHSEEPHLVGCPLKLMPTDIKDISSYVQGFQDAIVQFEELEK